MSHISILSQKPVLQATYFSLVETELKIGKSETQMHLNVLRTPVVCVFPMTDTYDLYLISQYRYLHEAQLLEEVAGHINTGEEPLAAAKRELSEETGIKAKKWKEFSVHFTSASVVKSKIHLYLAQDLTFEKAHPESDEQISLVKMSLSEAVSAVMNNKMQTSATMLGILMLDEMKRKGQI